LITIACVFSLCNFINCPLIILIETFMSGLLLQKRNFYRCITFIFLFLVHLASVAQKNQTAYEDSVFKKMMDTTNHSFTPARPFYIVQWKENFPASINVTRQMDKEIAIIEINTAAELESIKNKTRIVAANDQWKFSPLAEKIIETETNKPQAFILSGHHTGELLETVKRIKGQFTIIHIDDASRSIIVKTTAAFMKENLLPLKEIIFVDVRSEPHTEINIIGFNRGFHGLSAVDYSLPGANGNNIVTGVKEQKMDEADLDLYKRVIPSSLASANTTNHATVVSSIIGGAGNSFYNGRGIAWGCKFFSSSFSNLFADDAAVLNSNKVTVQNHSYGTVIQQFYGAEAVSYDAHTWTNKNFVHVFSAGNMGTASATTGQYGNIPGFANITGNFKMAKNIITVGAIDNKGNIAAESSAGPLYDGRVAPQLIALGPNGTSDAAAVVSGTIAVMQQVYADSNSLNLPPASLIKAILFNTAEDISRTGIDYKTGFGLLNSYAAIKSVQQREYDGSSLAQGQQWTKTISVPPLAAQLKVTLAWTDSAASVNNNKALTNDLDLEVMELNTGIVYRPWVLSTVGNVDSLIKQPTRKKDSLNTAEQVSISLAAAGNYQVKVIGTTVLNSSLPFNVSWHVDTLNTFMFTSPQHTSDVNRDEDPNLDIRWKTFVADTNQTGNLYISYNNGTGWQLLKSSLKIYANYYQWPIKDTNSPAVLKMETSFGTFFSKNFIISKVTRPVVEFLCTDSAALSWNKHIYANAYKIFSLTDSPYLKHILTITDTFLLLKRSQYPSLVYAVEPVLTNGIAAARSMAVDITTQGVKCFYKTFYHVLLDQNSLDLILELSNVFYVDSVSFDQVNITGQLLRTLGSKQVTGSILVYHQLVTDVPAGTGYWRARIKLKNGTVLYTEIISVLTSGKHYILFYPNPANRNSSLVWILQQGIPSDSRLQLYDITGRMLRNFSEIPNSINVSSLPFGIVIYKLYSGTNQLLETGKLMIQ
jgi:hypothetical protein